MASGESIIDPADVANTNLATMPQKSFENADRMLVQAATIRECADELQARIQTLYSKADDLQTAAFDLQRQGMQDRTDISRAFEDVVEQYKHVVPEYNLRHPRGLAKIALAVEEGRAFLEQIELLRDELRNSADLLDDAASPKDYPSSFEGGDIFEDALQTISNDDSMDSSSAATSTNIVVDPIHAYDLDLFSPRFANNDLRISDAQLGVHDPDVAGTALTSRKRKLQHPPESQHQLNDDDETPVSERKKKARISRGQRKKHNLSVMGYDDAEMSMFDVGAVAESLGKKIKKNRRARKKIENDEFDAAVVELVED